MTYECLGNNQYRITMYVYRDCFGGGAQFDSSNGQTQATISIFQTGIPGEFLNITNLDPVITSIPPNISNPCLDVPTDICVEEGRYQFVVTLPANDQGYTLTYQRCCRNNTILNINLPGDTGATYSVDITPEAMAICNSSPVFEEFPPIVICANQDINFDHSAIDQDGNADSLVYSFCAPLQGGGNDTSPQGANLPTGVAPNPDLPPPYQSVNFLFPTYSAAEPMAGDPIVSIDPQTGLISGSPTIVGQYVVGVCVEEWKDGEIISIIQRDFQFNVRNCEPLVVADILEDELLGEKEFLVNSCGNNEITFINQSFQAQNINEYLWQFEIDGTTFETSEVDATVTFPGEGLYEGVLMANPGTECGDTAQIFVNVYPGLEADFTFEYDTCVAEPVAFTNESVTEGSNTIVSYDWDFDDGSGSTAVDPDHLYGTPGQFGVSLFITDNNGCEDEVTNPVGYQPAPAILIVDPSESNGCAPQIVTLNNLSVPIDSTYTTNWTLGDGTTSTEISPTNTYTEVGVYTLTLEVISPIGCRVADTFPDLITVRPAPIPGFEVTPDLLTSFNKDISIIDESIDAVAWFYEFSDGFFSYQREPMHTLPDTGMYSIKQTVTHPSGCQDSITKVVDVIPEVTYHLPNAFTPNGDGSNEEYIGAGFLVGMRDFRMTIWNRWGELIFETTDPNQGWNGRKNGVGDVVQNGVYLVRAEYTTPRGERRRLKTFATVLR